MIHFSNQFKKITTLKYNLVVLIILCLFVFFEAKGQKNELFLDKNEYNATQIDAVHSGNQLLTINDPENAQSGHVTLEGNSYIKIWVDHNEPPQDIWYTYTVELSVAPLLFNGQPTTSPHTRKLTVEYNPHSSGGEFIDLALYEITNYRGAHVYITDVSYENMDSQQTYSGTPLNIMMETGIRVNRFYVLSQNPVSVSSSFVDEEIKLNWGTSPGALSYDVEWTWVDNYNSDPQSTSARPANSISLTTNEFRQNSTRINTKETEYRIPNIYANGYLVYRLRPVGVHLSNTSVKRFGPWSSQGSNSSKVSHWTYIALSNTEPRKNWQFQASYAEEGKRKDVVSYFDGTLRNRQTVTKINSDDNAIVGEVVYDNQGRPAVEILPVPAGDNEIRYYPNFNQSSDVNSTIGYSHYDFDWDQEEECDPDLVGLSTETGTGKYYSPNYSTGDYNDLTPSAVDPGNGEQAFPFSQIEYTPDNTGRISRKSGVGYHHQLGSGHEMKYYYATPEQVELDRLFGYSVGLAEHYKKNVVVDPNGQVSVSYIDPHGKTIATALAGDNPEMLIGLEDESNSNLHKRFTVNLLNNDPGQNSSTNYPYSTGNYGALTDEWRYEAQKVCVADNTQYEFDYDVTLPDQAYGNNCLPSGEGYPYVFDLVLNITDPCDSSLVPGGSETITVGNYTPPASGTPFSLIPTSPSHLFSKTIGAETGLPLFDIGNFGITKKLEINKEALDYFADDYIEKITAEASCLIDLDLDIDDSGCFNTCEECLYSLVNGNPNTDPLPTESDYIQLHTGANYTGYPEWSELDQTEQELIESVLKSQWKELKAICMAPCSVDGVSFDGSDNFETTSCTNGLSFMLSDMQPNGQYGVSYEVVDEDGNPITVTEVDAAETNVFNENNSLFYHNSNIEPNWRNPSHYLYDTPGSGHYYNTDGSVAKVEVELIDITNEEYDPPIQNGATVEGTEDSQIWLVEPQFLENVDDFLSVWENHWAESLVIYHPEYHYYEYSKELCSLSSVLNYTDPDSGNSVSATMNTDGYDLFLQDITYQEAKDIGFFNSTVSILHEDPYFYPNNNHPDDPTGANGNSGWKYCIMREALAAGSPSCGYSGSGAGNGYDGSDKTIGQLGYISVACNSIDFNCTPPSAGQVFNNIDQLTEEQQEAFWRFYVSNYLSLKQKVQYIMLNIYAMEQGGYNECIEVETSPEELTDVIQPYEAKGAIDNYINSINPTTELCDYANADIYNEKKKRYIPIDFLYNSEDDNETIADDLESQVDYTHYTSTGQCPMARDMELFLNGLATIPPTSGNSFYNFVNTNFAFTGYYFSPDLFEDFGGVFPNSGPLQVNTNASGQLLSIGFQNPSLNDVVELILSGPYTWNDYGNSNGWIIDQMREVYYIPGSYDNVALTYDFMVKARVRNLQSGAIQPGFSEIVLQGTTIARVGECGLASGGHTGPGEIIDDSDIPGGEENCEYLNTLYSCESGNNIIFANDAKGIYKFDVYIGYDVGNTIELSYDGVFHPDRFEVFFDEEKKDDSYFVSDDCSLLDQLDTYGSINVNEYDWNPQTSNFEPTGQSVNYNATGSNYFDPYPIPTSGCSNTGTLSFVKNSDTPYMTVQVTGFNTKNSWQVTILECDYEPCFNSSSACITQTVAPISCTDKYQDYVNGISSINDYTTIPDPLEEKYFCNMNFAYITDGYLYYLTKFNVQDVTDDYFISIGEFGATGLNYGYNDYPTVIDEYELYVTTEGQISWPEFVEIYLNEQLNICVPAPMIPHYVEPLEDDLNNCQEFVFNVTGAYAEDAYSAYIDKLKEEFKQDYIASAMSSVQETLEMAYDDKEYQYTLYHYDQAGNLNQTVPPQGVSRFEKSQLDGGVQNQIIQARNNNTTSSNALPDHTMETQYRYNSLNQLVEQVTPDGGRVRFAYDDLGRIIASQNDNQRNFWIKLLFAEESPGTYTFLDTENSIVKNINGWHGAYGSDVLEGNGRLSFVADERMVENFEGYIGISYASNKVINPERPYQDISYAVYCRAEGGETYLEFLDHGERTHEAIRFRVGDTIAIERANGYVSMYLNGGNPIVELEERKFNEPIRMDFSLYRAATVLKKPVFQAYDPNFTVYKITEGFSYTRYDNLGRIVEAGEIRPPNNRYDITNDGRLEYVSTGELLNDFQGSYTRKEVTKTYYDRPAPSPCSTFMYRRNCIFENCDRKNLRNRVSGILYYDQITPLQFLTTTFDNAIYYCYDIHGNVKEMVNYYPDLKGNNNSTRHLKRVNYDYDLISGNVKQVIYQKGKNDQFIHRYDYDADNRITGVETSSDGVIWEKDADYNYYEHGPLGRMVLGERQVQGVDYVYTLQGWLKTVNGEYLTDPISHDVGNDGDSGGNQMVARDAFSYSLGYFDGDYNARNSGMINNAFGASDNFPQNPADLYNGNIKQMVTSLRESEDNLLNTQFNHYEYDQLNRIKKMNSIAIKNSSISYDSYNSSYDYDRNGNLQDLVRNVFNSQNPSSNPIEMDAFSYHYKEDNNQLTLVNDNIGDGAFPNDIDDQESEIGVGYNSADIQSHNYIYDRIGQLTTDRTERQRIEWRVDGKVKRVLKYGSMNFDNLEEIIEFTYDGLGNRVSKRTINPTEEIAKGTVYARDAQGNVLSILETESERDESSRNYSLTSLHTREHHIFGSSRLGIEQKHINGIGKILPDIIIRSGDFNVKVGSNLKGEWFTAAFEREPQLTNANYILDCNIILTESLQVNDSIQIGNLFFSSISEREEIQGNELELYIKNTGNDYRPYVVTRSVQKDRETIEVHTEFLPHISGFSETEMLTKGIRFHLETLYTPENEDMIMVVNEREYLPEESLSITKKITETGNQAIDPYKLSTLGDTHSTFAIEDLHYRLTTEYNTIEDHWSLREGDGFPRSERGNVMEFVGTLDPWIVSPFPSRLGKRIYRRKAGDKRYELTNHLGNVLSVVSDKKIPKLASSGSLRYFNP
ncbi:DUF6443 domain-containing protein, partial [Mesonia maritima]